MWLPRSWKALLAALGADKDVWHWLWQPGGHDQHGAPSPSLHAARPDDEDAPSRGMVAGPPRRSSQAAPTARGSSKQGAGSKPWQQQHGSASGQHGSHWEDGGEQQQARAGAAHSGRPGGFVVVFIADEAVMQSHAGQVSHQEKQQYAHHHGYRFLTHVRASGRGCGVRGGGEASGGLRRTGATRPGTLKSWCIP